MFWKQRLLFFFGQFQIGEVIRNGYLLRNIREYLRDNQFVLDAGSGKGELVARLARKYPRIFFEGVDCDFRAVEFSKHRFEKKINNLNFRLENLVDFSKKEKYDIIYTVDVLEHVSDVKKVLKNFYQSLALNGMLIVHVPAAEKQRFFSEFKEYHQKDHFREGFDVEQFKQSVVASGFRIDKMIFTFGGMGGFVWEIFKKVEKIGFWTGLLFYPVFRLLLIFEFRQKNKKRGNGLLVVARKSI